MENILRSLLIITDNFWLGGRETFVAENVALLREHGLQRVSLIASNINNANLSSVFDSCLETSSIGTSDVATILKFCCKIIEAEKPELIWVQHFNIHLGLILADHHKLPLHLTLHGPISATGKHSHVDALALAVTLNRGGSYSCVSKELAESTNSYFPRKSFAGIVFNKVKRPAGNNTEPVAPADTTELKFVIFSRNDKLEHIRQALLLVATAKCTGINASLSVFTGTFSSDSMNHSAPTSRNKFIRLFGRKWLCMHPIALLAIGQVRIYEATLKVNEVIAQHDVVLGMGRVILEALASKKSGVLIGYDRPIGLVTTENFEQYQSTNFSGRGQTLNSKRSILGELKNRRDRPQGYQQERETLAKLVDIQASIPELHAVLARAGLTKLDLALDNSILGILSSMIENEGLEVTKANLTAAISEDEFNLYQKLVSGHKTLN